MRFQAIQSGIKPHDYALEFTLRALEARGHETYRIDGRTQGMGLAFDLVGMEGTIANTLTPFTETWGAHFTKPWILSGHGISLHKSWTVSTKVDLSLYPTQLWLDYGHVFVHHGDCKLQAVNGWGKMDAYWKLRQTRQTVRDEIYKQFALDITKPLVVYAPSWSRPKCETLELWRKNAPWEEAVYGNSGTEYMNGEVTHALRDLPIELLYMPHTGGCHAAIAEQFWPQRRVEILVAADLLISDVSSVAAEFLAMDKPIVLLHKHEEDMLPGDGRLFHRKGAVALFFGAYCRIERLDLIVSWHLEHAGQASTARAHWLARGVGTVDGHCAEREAEAIEKFAEEYRT